MKKLLLSLLILLPLGLVAAVQLNAKNLNSVFNDTFAIFQDDQTKVGINFDALEFDGEITKKLVLDAWLWRKGPVNTFDFKLSQFDYRNLPHKDPKLDFEASINLDLLKAIGRDQVNEMADSLEEIADEFAQDVLEDYGNAATATAKVVEKTKDKDGTYQSLKVVLKLETDYSQLPSDKTVKDVDLKSLYATINFTTHSVEVSADVVFNPEYRGFDREFTGLKENLDAIVNRDAQSLRDLQDMVYYAVSFLDELLAEDLSGN